MDRRTDANRLAALLEASTGPSPLLDAQLLHWAGIKAPGGPTASMKSAGDFVLEVVPAATWTVLGDMGEFVGTIMVDGLPAGHGARGATPALALLAALMRAV